MTEQPENTPGPAGPEIVAAYVNKYDGDLRIFLHQICEISAILGTPYDAYFDFDRGCFQWREGEVTLLAGPEERTVLLIDIDKVPKEPTGEALQELGARCHMRVQRADRSAKED